MSISEKFSSAVYGVKSSFHRLTTREGLWSAMITALWLGPMTFMIWVYAEREKPDNAGDQILQVAFNPPSPNRLVTLAANSPDDNIMVRITGSKSGVEAAKKLFHDVGPDSIVHIDVPPNMPDGPRSIAIVDEVRNAQIFKKYGVVVADVSPQTLNVQIDTMETIDANVVADKKDLLKDTPTFTPSTVKLTGPERLLKGKDSHGTPVVVYAQIPTSGDASRPGDHDAVPLQLKPSIPDDHLAIAVSQVMATYSIKQTAVKETISALPIFRMYGEGLENEVIVDRTRQTPFEVTIQGPPDEVKRVKARSIQELTDGVSPPFAYYKIQSNDKGTITRQVIYQLGEPDVIVTDPPKPPSVDFNVKSRSSSSP